MNVNVKLDEECWRCAGSGVHFDLKTNETLDGPCPSCHGNGRTPTKTGASCWRFCNGMHRT
jgi:DnaJ-class molecular chaperone